VRAGATVVVSERGSATLVTLAATLGLVGIVTAVIAAGSLLLHAERAQRAVDLAALAASDVARGVVPGFPCDVARAILRESGFALVSCTIEEGRSRVVARGQVGGVEVRARAHAGVPDGGQR